MAFTINPALPPQVWAVNQQVTIQLGMAAASTPSPSGWSATGLPTGLEISSTGKITGSTANPGVYDVVATATGSGSVTATLAFQIGIADRLPDGGVPGGAVEVDCDIRSGAVSVPGVTPGATGAISFSKQGDTIQFAIGLLKAGVLQELDLVTLNVGLKRREPERLLAESSGVFHRVGYGDGTRWVTRLALPASALGGDLAEQEADDGTAADFLAEIEASWNYWPPGVDPEAVDAEAEVIVRTFQTFKLRIERDWV